MASDWRHHPPHAITVHYPLALLASATFWDGLILFLPNLEPNLNPVAFFSLALGLGAAVVTLGTGLWDFGKLPERRDVERAAYLHLVIMLAAVCLYATSFALRFRVQGATPGLAVGFSLVGLVVLLGGSYFGGELVYRHGVGVRANAPEDARDISERQQLPQEPLDGN